MPKIERTANIAWDGNLARGAGALSAGTGAFSELGYSLATRIGEPEGKTSPEELLAAAHGGCLTMSLVGELTGAETPPGHLDVTPERVGDEIHRVPQRRQRADAVKFGEGRAPGLEERLRRDHQDVHAGWPSGRAAGVTKPTCYTTPRLVRPVSGHC